MPLYDYQCSQCNFLFERKLPMSDYKLPESDPCPECNKIECVTQVITAPAIGDAIRLGIKKPDAGWGEVLSKMKTAHPKGSWDHQKYVPTSGR
jgi:putative regulatory protein, FmdB family